MSEKLSLRIFGVLTFVGLLAVALWPSGPRHSDEAALRPVMASVAAPKVETVAEAPPAEMPDEARTIVPASKTFVVYFDFDSDALTADAQTTLAEAMRFAETLDGAKIDVAGHTDRAGSQAYNERLARHRAAAVAAEMDAGGMALAALNVQQFGEQQPMVSTADGIAEARNRRVEITITA